MTSSKTILATTLGLGLMSASAMRAPLPQETIRFSPEKSSELLERFMLHDKHVGAFLYRFLLDPDVYELLFKLPRNIALLEHWIQDPTLKAHYLAYRNTISRLQGRESNLITTIARTYNIAVLSVGSTYVFMFRDLCFSDSKRNVVIKAQRLLYPLLPDIRNVIKTTKDFGDVVDCASLFQLLSRMLYYQKAMQVITELELNHIRLPRKFVFPRPVPTDFPFSKIVDKNYVLMEEYLHDVIDKNYIVVEEYIPNPRSAQATWQRFAQLDTTDSGQEIFTEMEIVVQACGLWSLFPDHVDHNGFHTPNVFLVENDSAVTFVDLEKPGFGDPDERDVADYNEARLFHPRDDGMKQLAKIRSGVLAVPSIRR